MTKPKQGKEIKLDSPEQHRSMLPMYISETGAASEPVKEIIFCDSISGGAQYENDMPKSLTLVRQTDSGKIYRMRYVQADD